MQAWSPGDRPQALRAASHRHCGRSTGPFLDPPACSYKLAIRRSFAASAGSAHIARSTDVRADRQLKLGRGATLMASRSFLVGGFVLRSADRDGSGRPASASRRIAGARAPDWITGAFFPLPLDEGSSDLSREAAAGSRASAEPGCSGVRLAPRCRRVHPLPLTFSGCDRSCAGEERRNDD